MAPQVPPSARRVSVNAAPGTRKLRLNGKMQEAEVLGWLRDAKFNLHQYTILTLDEVEFTPAICTSMMELFQQCHRVGRILDRINLEFCEGEGMDLILTSAMLLDCVKHLFVASDRNQDAIMMRFSTALRLNSSLLSLWLLIPFSEPSALYLGEALAVNDGLDKLSLSGSNWDKSLIEEDDDDDDDDDGEETEDEDFFESDSFTRDSASVDVSTDTWDVSTNSIPPAPQSKSPRTLSTPASAASMQRAPGALAKGLKYNQTLRTLDLSCCHFKDDAASVLVEALVGHPSLQTLDLSRNRCRDRTMSALGKLVANSDTPLTTLDVREQCSRKRGDYPLPVAPFLQALSGNDTLRKLKLSNNRLDDSDIVMLVRNLQGNACLEELDLQWNEITELGLRSLTKGLSELPALEVLLLGGNSFGKEGNKMLAKLEDDDDSVCTIMETGNSGGKPSHRYDDTESQHTKGSNKTKSSTRTSSTAKTALSGSLLGGMTGISGR